MTEPGRFRHARCRAFSTWGIALVFASNLAGCLEATCNRHSDEPATAFRAGVTRSSQYMTGGPNEPYLDFPSGKRYRLFHGLSEAPAFVVPYVSFSPDPAEDGSGFSVSPGNQTVIRAVTSEYIEVENDTCTDFYLRVVAAGVSDEAAAAVSDAGPDGGN